MTSPVSLILSVLLLIGLPGCRSTNTDSPVSQAGLASQALQASFPAMWPSPGLSIKTTRPDIYIGNLDASIEALESLRLSDPNSHRLAALAELLYQRFRVTGSLNDLSASLITSRTQVDRSDASAGAWLTRARVLSGIHRFDQAREALNNALRAGARSEAINSLIDDINRTTGQAQADSSGDLLAQSQTALQQGRAVLAIGLLQQSERQLQATDPFVLSWSLLQQGVILLQHDLIEEANRVFAAAYQVLPDFYLAAEHLAETEALLGRDKRAAALYRQVIAQNDLPLFHWQLSMVLTRLGQTDLAISHLEKATSGYDSLLESWPDTFGDHAIDFLVQQGDTTRALRLARRLVDNQPTVANRVMLAETALVAQEVSEACDQWTEILSSGNRSIQVLKLAETLAASCL